jgi:hypothetical protein
MIQDTRLHLKVEDTLRHISTLKMEMVGSPEKWVTIYEVTRHRIPKVSNLIIICNFKINCKYEYIDLLPPRCPLHANFPLR